MVASGRREKSTWNITQSQGEDRVQFQDFWHPRVAFIFTLVAQQSLLFELCKWMRGGTEKSRWFR